MLLKYFLKQEAPIWLREKNERVFESVIALNYLFVHKMLWTTCVFDENKRETTTS